MSDETKFWLSTGIILAGGLAALGALMLSSEQERAQFITRCTNAGGVPTEFSEMIGKMQRRERLCVQPNAIIELR